MAERLALSHINAKSAPVCELREDRISASKLAMKIELPKQNAPAFLRGAFCLVELSSSSGLVVRE